MYEEMNIKALYIHLTKTTGFCTHTDIGKSWLDIVQQINSNL